MKNLMDHVQRDALVMITQAYRRTPTAKLYKETGFETLGDRRRIHRLVLYYKMQHDLVPEYLCNLVPPPSGESHNYILRSITEDKLTIPFARTARYAKYFINNTVKNWNELDIHIRQSTSINIFKSKLKQIHPENVAALLTGRASVHHTRMRLGLSPLKDQLYKFGIIESYTCEYCTIESETSIHYFLKCPCFSSLRNKLLAKICQIVPFDVIKKLQKDQELVDFFLNGSAELSKAENLLLFDKVHKFIERTERFL